MTASIHTAVRTRFNSAFPALRPTVPVAYQGFKFDPDEDARDASRNPIPWVRLSLIPGGRVPIGLGSSQRRNIGIVWIQGFAPIGTGPALLEEIIRDAGSVFESQTISGVTFRSAVPQRLPDEEAWQRYDVQINYVSDEIP